MAPVRPISVVTGGSGFFGRHLVRGLLNRGHDVRLVDLHPPPDNFLNGEPGINEVENEISEVRAHVGCSRVVPNAMSDLGRLEVLLLDIRNEDALTEAFEGAAAVFHTASVLKFWSDSSLTPASEHKLIESINVKGTQSVINACIACRVERLVCTSSNVVVVNSRGDPIDNGDETMQYPARHADIYSRTKKEAELLVLNNNGTLCRNVSKSGPGSDSDRVLYTSVVRPAGGIYGPGEALHLPRILNLAKRGLVCVQVGSPSTLCDWVFVDNLVYAHLLVADHLPAGPQPWTSLTGDQPADDITSVAGQVFLISDDHPINNNQFIKQFVECIGIKYPRIAVSAYLLYYAAFLMEIITFLLWCGLGIQMYPLLTRGEVFKAGTTQYSNISRAKRVLGYQPIVPAVDAMALTVQWCAKTFSSSASLSEKKGGGSSLHRVYEVSDHKEKKRA